MSRMMHRRSRHGFTLIEMLVTMAIIAILVGITIPAVQKFREYGPRVQCRNDIAQITQAIEGYKTTYNVAFLPSAFIASADYDNTTITGSETLLQKADSRKYYKSVWPRGYTTYGVAPNPPYGTGLATQPTQDNQKLDGSQCLVFFLNGPKKTGFNEQPQPFSSGGTKLFLEWPSGRYDSSGTRFTDPWGTPYVYFTSKVGNDYNYNAMLYYGNSTGAYSGVEPYKDVTGSKYLNSHSYQIISAGKNKVFGPGGAWTPGSGAYAFLGNGSDDLSNFATRMLVAGE